MLHYTLNTGHTRVSPRSEVSDEIIDYLRPILANGTHKMPNVLLTSYKTRVGIFGSMAYVSIWHKKRPCASFGIAINDADAVEMWKGLQSQYHSVTDAKGFRSADFAVAKQPELTPWCAAIVLMATPEEAEWMADFERCFAWAWIERCKGRSV